MSVTWVEEKGEISFYEIVVKVGDLKKVGKKNNFIVVQIYQHSNDHHSARTVSARR